MISGGCLISELGGSRFWFDGPKLLWGDLNFDSMIDDPGCSVDELLGCNKVCLLVQENSKTNLKFIELEKYSSYVRLISITALVLGFI